MVNDMKATPAGKYTGGGWWPPTDEKPFEAVQAARVVSSGSRSCQSPWGPRSCCWMYVQENINHFHSKTFPVYWKLFFSSLHINMLPKIQLKDFFFQKIIIFLPINFSPWQPAPWAHSQWLPVARYGSVDAWWSLWGAAAAKVTLSSLFKFLFMEKCCRDVALCTDPG